MWRGKRKSSAIVNIIILPPQKMQTKGPVPKLFPIGGTPAIHRAQMRRFRSIAVN
jgi:hypothetical protein